MRAPTPPALIDETPLAPGIFAPHPPKPPAESILEHLQRAAAETSSTYSAFPLGRALELLVAIKLDAVQRAAIVDAIASVSICALEWAPCRLMTEGLAAASRIARSDAAKGDVESVQALRADLGGWDGRSGAQRKPSRPVVEFELAKLARAVRQHRRAA